jgi:hypothetical protein
MGSVCSGSLDSNYINILCCPQPTFGYPVIHKKRSQRDANVRSKVTKFIPQMAELPDMVKHHADHLK